MLGEAGRKKFYKKCSENSRFQIVFRTDIFQKLTLGAPDQIENEEAIKSTRDRIYSLKVFYFLLYRRRYFLFVSELIQYACQRRPEVRLRSQAIRLYKYTKIQGPRFQRNYIIVRDQKSDLHGTSFKSSPKINRMLITRPFAYNESLQHPTIAVLLIKILLFFF